MGYDILVYFNVDQDDVNNYIKENNLDKTTIDGYNKIKEYCKNNYLNNNKNIHVFYVWDRENEEHKIISSYGINFIRDDNRFYDDKCIKELEEKYGRKPSVFFKFFYFCMKTPDDAKRIAEEISIFFPDEDDLMHFANWLKETSNYNVKYELSR